MRKPEQASKARLLLLLLFLAIPVIFIVSSGCEKRQEKKEEQAIPVRVMTTRLRDVSRTLEYAGDVEAQDMAVVYPSVSGKVIEKVKQTGAVVNKDDPVIYVDRDETGFKFEKAPVKSPIGGIIGRFYVDKGMHVNPQTRVALVVDIEEVEIELHVPGEYLPDISIGLPAEFTVDAYPGRTFEGNISEISPVLDKETRSAPLKITVANHEHLLKPGMFARVELVIETHQKVPVVRREAVMGDAGQSYVYVVQQNRALRQKVETGLCRAGYVEITGGLEAGNVVVIMGQQRLSEGARVITESGETGQ